MGAGGGVQICMQKTSRSVFLVFVLRVMHAKVKNINHCAQKITKANLPGTATLSDLSLDGLDFS